MRGTRCRPGSENTTYWAERLDLAGARVTRRAPASKNGGADLSEAIAVAARPGHLRLGLGQLFDFPEHPHEGDAEADDNPQKQQCQTRGCEHGEHSPVNANRVPAGGSVRRPRNRIHPGRPDSGHPLRFSILFERRRSRQRPSAERRRSHRSPTRPRPRSRPARYGPRSCSRRGGTRDRAHRSAAAARRPCADPGWGCRRCQ